MAERRSRRHPGSEAGFTLLEMLISLVVTTIIAGVALTAMSQATRANESAVLTTGMNNNLRTAMDLVVRDMLQVGQGLPAGRVVLIPFGLNSAAIRRPGPPGTDYTFPVSPTMSAVTVGPGLGPAINGAATDMITTIAGDSAFDHVSLTALAADGTSMTVDPAVDISNGGPDDVRPGDIIMFTKGTLSAMQQVTRIDGLQTAFFDANDSLDLNQRGAEMGTIMQLLATAPADVPSPVFVPTQATRIRMLSYYLDTTTDPTTPRLIRRLNNGSPTVFNTPAGTTVAFAVENLQVSFDLADGLTNPANVRMTAADLAAGGACGASACSPNQIRKANIFMAGRSQATFSPSRRFLRNSLTTEVSFRSLAFVDRYR